MTNQYISVSDIARLLEVHKMTVYRMLKRKEMRSFRVGGQYRVKHEWFADYLRRIGAVKGA